MEKEKSSSNILNNLMAYVGASAGVFTSFMIVEGLNHPGPLIVPVLFGISALGIYRLAKNNYQRELDALRKEKQLLLEKISGINHWQPNIIAPNETPLQAPLLKAEKESLEVRIMDVLALQKGRFTLVEAVVYLREPIDKILPVLEKLQQSGILGTDVSDAGEIIYVTSSFRNTTERLA